MICTNFDSMLLSVLLFNYYFVSEHFIAHISSLLVD